jgi:tRNA-dihydrouridine synthase B
VVRRAAVGEGLGLMVIQLVGREEHFLARGAALAEAAGADLIDINMGCPAKEVTGALSGSALMRDLDQAERLLAAAVGATSRPVTLKMRLGWDEHSRNAPELAARAAGAGIKAIAVHGRTRQQFYGGAADWRAVGEVRSATALPLIVNGDVTDAATAREALRQSGAAAVMIGRGAYGRPWIGAALDRALLTGGEAEEPDLASRLPIALDHLADTLRFYGDAAGLRIFRKHLGWYIERAGAPHAPETRRAAKAQACRLDTPRAIETFLTALWQSPESWRAAA